MTLKLTPDYLTINQSEGYPQTDRIPHNPSPSPVSKDLSLKAIGDFGPFEN